MCSYAYAKFTINNITGFLEDIYSLKDQRLLACIKTKPNRICSLY